MRKRWTKSLEKVLREHNSSVADKTKRAGDRTKQERRRFLTMVFSDLDKAGFHLENVHNFRDKHVRELISQWEKSGKKPATIQTYLSGLRVFCGWLGKAGMIQASAKMVSSPEKAQRSIAAKEDKSWDVCGLSADELIGRMRLVNPRMAAIMRMARAFGLRLKEAYMVRPNQADQDQFLIVNWGTKGGKRRRSVAISTQEQRGAVEEAKQFAKTSLSSMVPDGENYITFRNRTRWDLDAIGMTRKKLGITFHGARHAYLNERFKEVSGVESPIRSSQPVMANDDGVEFARQIVAEEAGHARKSVSSAYLGHFARGKKTGT